MKEWVKKFAYLSLRGQVVSIRFFFLSDSQLTLLERTTRKEGSSLVECLQNLVVFWHARLGETTALMCMLSKSGG